MIITTDNHNIVITSRMKRIKMKMMTIKLVPACLSVLPKLDCAPTIDMLKQY